MFLCSGVVRVPFFSFVSIPPSRVFATISKTRFFPVFGVIQATFDPSRRKLTPCGAFGNLRSALSPKRVRLTLKESANRNTATTGCPTYCKLDHCGDVERVVRCTPFNSECKHQPRLSGLWTHLRLWVIQPCLTSHQGLQFRKLHTLSTSSSYSLMCVDLKA